MAQSSLLKAVSLFTSNTFISRITGFIRDMVLAHYFGADSVFDAFIMAFRIPNFMRRLFAEGAFSQAFVPILAEYRATRSMIEVRSFMSHMSGSLGAILLFVTILGIFAAPVLMHLFAPGFGQQDGRFALASHLLQITFPYLMLVSLTALCCASLNVYDSFGIPAFTPVWLNIIMTGMASVGVLYFRVPIYAVAWGVFIAGILQIIFLLPFLAHKKILVFPKINFKDSGVIRVLKLMIPALAGVSVAQLSILIDSVFASYLKTGSVSFLYYSDRLMSFPLGMFGVAIATVILPRLSRDYAKQSITDYSKTLDWAIRALFTIGIPAAVCMFLLAGPLLSTLFQGGRFDQTAVLMCRKSVMAFAIGIQAFMLVKVLASAFYAKQDIKTPVKILMLALFINMGLNFVLMRSLAHAGLALSSSLAGIVNAGCLLGVLLSRKQYQPGKGWKTFFLRLLLANSLLVIFLLFITAPTEQWVLYSHLKRIGYLTGLLSTAMVIYILALFSVGMRLSDFKIRG